VLWLARRDPGPFRALTSRVCPAFPAFPPYGGQFDDVIPHLTIGHGHRLTDLRAAGQSVQPHLPISVPAVMRGQLRHLIAMCELPDVTLQVLSLASGVVQRPASSARTRVVQAARVTVTSGPCRLARVVRRSIGPPGVQASEHCDLTPRFRAGTEALVGSRDLLVIAAKRHPIRLQAPGGQAGQFGIGVQVPVIPISE
jgi:Domain of unknown function (DUF5753)